jgi:ribosome-associated protein
MALPERLHDAVAAAKQLRGFEARRRQLQYIGKLMRALDPEPIRAQLDAWRAPAREHAAELRLLERWRERLLTESSALNEFIESCPHADAQRLRMLIRNAQREQATDAPRKSYRALFRLLREILASRLPPPASL